LHSTRLDDMFAMLLVDVLTILF